MKSMLLAFLTIACASMFAQITVTSSALPNVGDTIRTALDTSGMVDPLTVGGPKVWAFGQLTNHRSTTLVYQSPNMGNHLASFPGADLMTIGQNGAETYYNRTNSELSVLGYAGLDPSGFGVNVIARFEPPFILQRAPMNFFDVKQASTNLVLAFSLDDLPDSLINIPIPGVDSIRIRFTTNRLDVVDAFGTITIPGQTEEVLREKRTETSETGLDIHSFLGWFPLPTGGGGLPGGGAGFLGTDTTISYHFFANNVKEDIASIQLDTDLTTPWRTSFKRNATSSTTEPIITLGDAGASVHAYPNPAVDEVSFECRNLNSGTYSLKLFNLLGKTVWSQEYQIAGSKSIKVDLDKMRKGTYLYSLSDQNGKVIATKRLVIIKP
jgi:hypothetical protein